MNKFIYEMPPIDFWTGWSTIRALSLQNNVMDPYYDNPYFEGYRVNGREDAKEFFSPSDYAEAQEIVRAFELIKAHTSWEGDGYLYVTAQPNDEYIVSLCFAIKQGNNGTTFLCSDYELPNLKQYQVN